MPEYKNFENMLPKLEKLKVDWVADPHWDIYDTEGFEDYREHLKEFQEEKTKEWADKQTLKDFQRCELWGVSPMMLKHLDRLHQRIEDLENLVERLSEKIYS